MPAEPVQRRAEIRPRFRCEGKEEEQEGRKEVKEEEEEGVVFAG